jgi:hypothetical protein
MKSIWVVAEAEQKTASTDGWFTVEFTIESTKQGLTHFAGLERNRSKSVGFIEEEKTFNSGQKIAKGW